jgi:hypothetical protein
MAPIAATAAAVTLWMVVPQEQLRQQAEFAAPASEVVLPAPQAGARARDEAPQVAQPANEFSELKRQAEKPQAGQEKLGAASANVADAASATSQDRRDAKEEQRSARLEAEPARSRVVAPAAPPPPAAPAAAAPAEAGALRENAPITQLRKQVAPLEFLSPDPQRRWRVTADGIERSEDGGRTWLLVRLAQGEVMAAGASPSPLVCWIVGRGGLVLLATDGANFTRLPFPERVDLTAVSSPEPRIAVVTAADGRVFRTENAGRSWRQQ